MSDTDDTQIADQPDDGVGADIAERGLPVAALAAAAGVLLVVLVVILLATGGGDGDPAQTADSPTSEGAASSTSEATTSSTDPSDATSTSSTTGGTASTTSTTAPGPTVTSPSPTSPQPTAPGPTQPVPTTSTSVGPTTAPTLPVLMPYIQGFAFEYPHAWSTTITVENRDASFHTFTSDDGKFDSGSIPGGSSTVISVAGLSAGVYPFHCEIHPTMTENLIVH